MLVGGGESEVVGVVEELVVESDLSGGEMIVCVGEGVVWESE